MSLTIRQYAFLFATLTIVFLAGFIYKTSYEFDQTRSNINHSQQLSANKEFTNTLKQTLSELDINIQELSEWDEIHQQINNPVYFAYWYNLRLKQAIGELRKFISDIMIYDVDGVALAKLVDSKLPTQLESPLPDKTYYFQDETSLIYTTEITDKDSGKLKGYISIRTNLISMLLKQNSFYYVKPDTITIVSEIMQQNLSSLKPIYFLFDRVKTPELSKLEDQLLVSIITLTLFITVPAVIIYSLFVYIITVPVNDVMAYIRALRESNDVVSEHESKSFFKVNELKKISESLHQYHSDLFHTYAQLDEKNKALWSQAHRDALTSTYNRRAFDEQWANLSELLSEHRIKVCFILFDVNIFKAINDTHGHQVGDAVLKGIVECIQFSLRKGEHLFRMGGDEFATFLIDCDAQAAEEVARRCIKATSEYPFKDIGMPEPVRVSIGISQTLDDSPESFRDLIWQADAAMYAAKRPGNKDYVIYSDEITGISKGLLSSWLGKTVYEAIEQGSGLVLFYQPIIDFEKNNISYYEALVRIHTEDTLLMPGSIFNVIETRHFEVELDRAVINKLQEDLSDGKLPRGTGVSINLSGPTLTKSQVVEWLFPLTEFIADYKIVVEVTETSLITELQRVTGHLKEIQKLGFIIALDDFGSGYSSVKYLASMPVDVVKFDITLIQCLLDDQQRLMIMRLAHMIEEAGHQLVAEGIESESILGLVLKSGFQYGQGFLFGKAEEVPMQQKQLESYVSRIV